MLAFSLRVLSVSAAVSELLVQWWPTRAPCGYLGLVQGCFRAGLKRVGVSRGRGFSCIAGSERVAIIERHSADRSYRNGLLNVKCP